MRAESARVPATERPRRLRWPVVTAMAVIGATLLGYTVWREQRGANPVPLTLEQMTESGDVVAAAISDDGKYVAYAEAVKDGFSLMVSQVQTKATVTIIPAGTLQFRGLTFSRDGAYIYATTASPASLVRVPTLGGSPVKLLDDIATAVSFSPDGRQLAFVRARNNEAELVVASADGSNSRAIALEKRPPFGAPAWSPDGTSIAWPHIVPRADAALTVTSVDGGRSERITVAGWHYVDSVVWLPTSRGFVITAEEATRELTGRHQILEISLSGAVVQRLTNDLNDYHGITGNPQTSLAAVPLSGRSGISVGWLATPDTLGRIGSGKTDGARGLAWSAGKEIVFTDIYSIGWVMRDDGSGLRSLLPERQTAVSPVTCGRAVAYGVARGMLLAVFVVDPNGGTPRHVSDIPFGTSQAACTPDGAWLLYVDNETIKKVPITGGQPTVVLKDAHDPRVSPDGRLLAAHTITGGTESFVIASLSDGALVGRVPGPVGRGYAWDSDSAALVSGRGAGNVDNLWRLPIDGSPPRQMTNFTSDVIFNFAIAGDGRLAIARGENLSDVVILRR
jgi:Tol biopolymer transport system component